jgi:glycyl-tRNA synthetase beta chain
LEVLLEIGMEEIPARFLKNALTSMEKYIETEFKSKRIKFESVTTFGTPRRLIINIKGVSSSQEDLSETNVGPAKKVAYNEAGELSKAALGFAKSQGVDVNDLKMISTDKGEYIAVSKFIKGVEVKKLLPDILKNLITTMSFPKSMKWGTNKMRFARPIKWILALADRELIEFEIEGLKTELKSCGHRFFGKQTFKVESISDYFEKVKENYVIVDIEERRERIKALIAAKCTKTGEEVLVEDELLDEVTNLVEYPYPVVGTFNSEFLEVPQEVLIITMQVHQRYFPVLDSNGKLMPKFVIIRNGIEHSENVKTGNEKVISARLSDARFFFYEDLKKSPDKLVEGLKDVVFQKDIGTIYGKVERNKKLAAKMCEYLDIDGISKENVLRTVHLAKFDLLTNMISEKEYTKLQGFMGMVYAEKAGENKEVAKGIFEHYLPRFQGDILPESNEGVIASITDKLDTVVGCFGVGLIPSGSQDPYALRRAALGIVNIILNSKLQLSTLQIVRDSIELYEAEGRLKRTKEEIEKDVMEFIKARVINVLIEKGHRKDVVEAVVAAGFENIAETSVKVELLEKMSSSDEFKKLVTLVKRVRNISKDFSEGEVIESLLKESAEKELYSFYKELSLKNEGFISEKKYGQLFETILSGTSIINSFFDNIMVMDKDESVKTNRVSLLKKLDKVFNEVAVISMISE